MKDILRYSLIAAIAATTLSSCYKEPEFKVTDKGPEMTCEIAKSANMGENLPFKVTLKDNIALSTLQLHLFFDGTEVSKKVIRTKESGVFEGTLEIPYYADISDGTADLTVTAQNIEFGLTEEKRTLSVTRPDFEYLTLTTSDGEEVRMDKVGEYEYSCTSEFPKELKAKIVSAPFGSTEERLTFGFDGKSIAVGGSDYIPFTYGYAGEYTVTLNTKTLVGAPFVTLSVNGETPVAMEKAEEIPAGSYGVNISLKQGETLSIMGFDLSDWTIDSDYLETIDINKGEFKFLPVTGQYRVVLQTSNKFIRINPMKPGALTGKDYFPVLGDDFSGGLWAIGDETIGKPEGSGHGWAPEVGGLCCAPVKPKVFQLTLVAGHGLGTKAGSNFKFFFQRTWGGELKGASYSEVNLPAELGMTADGNIGVASELKEGDRYRFTIDFSSAKKTSGSAEGVKLVGVKL